VILRLSALTLLLALLPGHAQSPKTGAAISLAGIRSVLQAMGVEFTEKLSGDSTAFAFPLNGRLVTLVTREKGFQLSACFEDRIPLLKWNQWNREHFSTRVNRDDQGCPSLVADVGFGGSATKEMVADFIAGFLTDVTIYARFVSEALAGPAEAPPSPIGPMEWTQSGQHRKRLPPWTDQAEPVAGLLAINRNISLKYNPDRWKPSAPDSHGQLVLVHASGEAHALIIAEPVGVPHASVDDIALANAQSVDPAAAIVYRQQRRVNGAVVRFLKIEAEVNAVPMVYWGLYYGGEYGTVQIVTYAAKNGFPQYEKEFTDLLEGFTAAK